MKRRRYDRVMDLFLAAGQLQDDQREAFLNAACAGDEDLRHEIESLLEHHHQETISTKPRFSAATEASSPVKQRRNPLVMLGRRLPAGSLRPLVGAAVLTLSLFVVAYWLHHQIESTLRTGLARYLEYAVSANVAALRDWTAEKKALVTSWAADDRVRESIIRLAEEHAKSPLEHDAILASPDYQRLLELLSPFYNRSDSAGFGVVSPDGVNLAHSREQAVGARLMPENASYLTRVALGETLLVQPTLEPGYVDVTVEVTEPVMAAVAPVLKDNDLEAADLKDANRNNFVAALSFGFSSNEEFADLLSAQAGKGAESFIVNDKGLLLSNLTNLEPLYAAGLLTAGESSALNVELRDPGVDLTTARPIEADEVLPPLTTLATSVAAQQSGMNLDGYRNLVGQQVVGAWTYLPEYGFAVATEILYEQAFAPLGYVRVAFRTLFAIVLLLAVAIVLSTSSIAQLRSSLSEAQRLGQYTLLSLIGEGGMGKVYLAQHALLRRPTALKLFDGEKADAASVARFEREVQLTSQLWHPSTIQIYDYGRTAENVFYYAMEFLDGFNLAELVSREGPLPTGRVIYILRQVCGSLNEAHQRGLIHRDVKPANVMICHRGGIGDVVKVLDFGLVKQLAAEGREDVTRSQQVGGTPRYIAPERVTSPAEVDARSDLYSVGAVAYFLITGREVFQGRSPLEAFAQASRSAPPEPALVDGIEVPATLNRLVVQCLAVSPADRPQSAAAILEVLEELAEDWPWSSAEADRWWAVHADSMPHRHLAEQEQVLPRE